jgi:hypothetical protein
MELAKKRWSTGHGWSQGTGTRRERQAHNRQRREQQHSRCVGSRGGEYDGRVANRAVGMHGEMLFSSAGLGGEARVWVCCVPHCGGELVMRGHARRTYWLNGICFVSCGVVMLLGLKLHHDMLGFCMALRRLRILEGLLSTFGGWA